MNQEKIGKFIAENRKKKKLTQSELAERLGVTDRSISNWENGKNMPDLSLFKPLCDNLDITINELISGEKLNNKEYNEKLEENIINTIDYIDKKNNYNSNKKNILLLIIGIIGYILVQLLCKEIEGQQYLSIVCMIISISGLVQLTRKYLFVRRIIAIIIFVICAISFIVH